MAAPVLKSPIPAQAVNERAAFGPFDLSDYFEASESELHFVAQLPDGSGLPKGMICLDNGIVTGIPAKGTRGEYAIQVEVSNDDGDLQATFNLNIMPAILEKDSQEYFDDLKQRVWQALDQNLPIPDISDLLGRDVTPLEVYLLLERWATIKIYNVADLSAPGAKQELKLEGMSDAYVAYDRGSCLVASPRDIFSDKHTIADGIKAAQALAREAYKREWAVELIGFDKLTRAAWIEVQHLIEQHKKPMDVMNYEPTVHDLQVYRQQSDERILRSMLEK